MKIDVAVNSYKKPESLIYTLMTLKKVAGDLIDTVYINDDCSNDGTCDFYRSPAVQEYFKPWKLDIRENHQNIYMRTIYVKGYYVAYMNWLYRLKHRSRFINRKNSHDKYDIRYQYALEHTDKKYLFVIHDDVQFYQNVPEVYLKTFAENPDLTIVGDFGQCWRCHFSPFCTTKDVLNGKKPSVWWPYTPNEKIENPDKYNPKQGFQYACRVNEWCCMLNVKQANEVTEKTRAFFGNTYSHADTGAYWFAEAVRRGYKFADPLLEKRDAYYKHQWQGYTGTSVWEDQGSGKAVYNRQQIIDLMKSEFNFEWPEK
ncbi:MAG: hypothetical protein IJ545_07605 [Alphaproteobacteria bacterium]|nr:hypothetical protein [Alphaproteobacteria bacterium]